MGPSTSSRVALLQPLADSDQYQESRLKVDRIEQERDWYCGAACAVMFTEFFQVDWDQTQAYAKIHDPARFEIEQLYSDPSGIARFLNTVLAEKLSVRIAECDPPDAKTTLDSILRCLRRLELPALCLTHGGDHWIVVEGIRYIEHLDGSKDYIGVYIQNPWYNFSPNAYVDVDEFVGNWITPNVWGRQWLNKRIVMSDGDATAIAENRISPVGNRQIRAAVTVSVGSPPDPTSLALRAVRAHGFTSIRATAGGGATVRAPVRVSDTDSRTFYWIVMLDASDVAEFQAFVYAAVSEDGQKLFEVARSGRQLDIPTIDETRQDVARLKPGRAIVVDEQLRWGKHFMTPSRFDVYYNVTVDGEQFFYLRNRTLVSSLEAPRRAGG
ncbi:hypothetical protein [Bradyrhizobium diazoefficiens]